MFSGHFFEFDFNNSETFGFVSFRYLGIKRTEPECLVKLPVYVSFSKDEVAFYFHRANEESIETQPASNYEIFSLPLTVNRYRDNLRDALVQIYKEKLTSERFSKSLEIEDTQSGYRSLQCFKSSTEDENTQWQKIVENQDEDEGKFELNYPFKVIFLDFLFDINHSQVFRHSPWYDEALEKLNQNYLFNAISAKAEYHYQRSLLCELKPVEEIDGDKTLTLKRFDDFWKSEAVWLSLIKREESKEEFPDSAWFNTSEEELKNTYESEVLGIETEYEKLFITEYPVGWGGRSSGKNSDNEIKEFWRNARHKNEHTIRWLMRRYAIRSALLFWGSKLAGWMKILIFVLAAGVCGFILHSKTIVNTDSDLFNYGLLLPFIFVTTLILISIAFKFFPEAIIPQKGICSILDLFAPRLIVANLAASTTLLLSEDYWKDYFDISYSGSIGILSVFIIVIFFFLLSEVRAIASDIEYEKKRFIFFSVRTLHLRVGFVIILSFFYSSFINFAIISTRSEHILERSQYLEDFLKEYYEESKSDSVFNAEVKKYLRPDTIKGELKIQIVRENVFSDILKAKVIDDSSNIEAWNTIISQERKKLYVLTKLPPLKDGSGWFQNFDIALKIRFLERCGECRICDLDNKGNCYKCPCNRYEYFFFPSFWLLTTAITMFIGIFIQLLYEDKAVTEPL